MLISIIHSINGAQGLNLDSLNSLGADKDAGGEGEVLGWGCSTGMQGSGGGRLAGATDPIFGLIGVFKSQQKACGSWQGHSQKAECSTKGILSRREGKSMCAEWLP